MKGFSLACILLSVPIISFAQIDTTVNEQSFDTLRTLDEVTVRAFEQNRRQGETILSSVKVIELNNADRYNRLSLVAGFNTVAGVRMEERSPGSYRINIRGSSLRSPFGVRNIKIYWNEIPLTDPGGNSYFNQLAHNNFSSITIVKGPAGSMYGAGTGGLILIDVWDSWKPGWSFDYLTGSFGVHNVFASARFGKKDNKNQLTFAHNQSDGYRIQSKMRRDNFSWQSRLKVSDKQQLDASVLFTDMYYQTPGALTLNEYNIDPRQARPAAGGFPSAVNAKAAIFQKNFSVGLTNTYYLTSALKNATMLYGAFAHIKNPAVRNYERRNEPSFGGRTLFTWNKNVKTFGSYSNTFQWVAGTEFQKGLFNTLVSNNRNGNPDTIQTNDDIDYTVYNFFVQGDISIKDKWFFHAGASINKTKVVFTRLNNYPVLDQKRNYQNELAPRLSFRGNLTSDLSVRATVARGFSPPTIAELLPSTGAISTELEAESGWNYELMLAYRLFNNKLNLEATAFHFKLNNALVQRRDISGADFFVNAGDTKQTGFEFHADFFKSFAKDRKVDYLRFVVDYTYNHFRYGSFIKGNDDFSGKTLPSVPSNTLSAVADIFFYFGLYSNLTYYGAGPIFLNDANTASAESYHLLGWRLGWRKTTSKKYRLNIFAGVENLLDEKYSLGNDINAAANRFYNAAPYRNYYVGISFQWIKNN